MGMKEKIVKKIAKERVEKLLELAEQRTRENNELSRKLAKRYVRLARDISMHYKVGIPKEKKRIICKRCNNFLIPGINCSVRIASSNKYVVYKCECGAEKHIFYKQN